MSLYIRRRISSKQNTHSNNKYKLLFSFALLSILGVVFLLTIPKNSNPKPNSPPIVPPKTPKQIICGLNDVDTQAGPEVVKLDNNDNEEATNNISEAIYFKNRLKQEDVDIIYKKLKSEHPKDKIDEILTQFKNSAGHFIKYPTSDAAYQSLGKNKNIIFYYNIVSAYIDLLFRAIYDYDKIFSMATEKQYSQKTISILNIIYKEKIMNNVVDAEEVVFKKSLIASDCFNFIDSEEFNNNSIFENVKKLFKLIDTNLFIKIDIELLSTEDYYTLSNKNFIYAFLGKRLYTFIFLLFDLPKDWENIKLKTKEFIILRIKLRKKGIGSSDVKKAKTLLKEHSEEALKRLLDVQNEVDINIIIEDLKKFSERFIKFSNLIEK